MKGITLHARYVIDISQKTPIPEEDQKQEIVRILAHHLAYKIAEKPGFFSEELVIEKIGYTPTRKMFNADCIVLTNKEYAQLVEEIRQDVMRYMSPGYLSIIDHENNKAI
jgi:hypothetical protein